MGHITEAKKYFNFACSWITWHKRPVRPGDKQYDEYGHRIKPKEYCNLEDSDYQTTLFPVLCEALVNLGMEISETYYPSLSENSRIDILSRFLACINILITDKYVEKSIVKDLGDKTVNFFDLYPKTLVIFRDPETGKCKHSDVMLKEYYYRVMDIVENYRTQLQESVKHD